MRWPIPLRSCCTATLWRVALRARGSLSARDPAQGLVEYGLILLMIAIVCIAIVTLMGQNLSQAWYQKIVDAWPH